MIRIITVFLIALSFAVHGQTYKTVTGVLNDSTTLIRSGTYTANLDNRYAQIQDGLISGGEATIGIGSVTIDTAKYRINKVNYQSLPRTFTGIANSESGTQYYILVYGKTDNTLDTLQGVQDTIATIPTKPNGTVAINTVLVGDGGVESSVPDLTGYVSTTTNQTISGDKYFTNNVFNGKNRGFWMSGISSFATGISSQRTIPTDPSTDGEILYLQTNSIPRFRIFKNGNVGIGSYTLVDNGNLLQVRGNVNITGSYLINGSPINSGTVTNVSALTLGTTGTDLSSSVANSTTTPVITLNVPTASATNRGALSSTDWTTFNNKQSTVSFTTIGATPNANGGSISSGVITLQPANASFGGLVTTGTQSFAGAKTFNSTVQSTNFGAGIAPSTSTFLNLGVPTTAASSLRIPYGVAPTTPVTGDIWGLTTGTRLQRFDGTNTKDFIFDKTNFQFVGTGVRALTSNQTGDLAATTPILETYTTDTDVITALLAATYSPTAILTPASSKVFYKGQLYYASGSLYFATADNVALKTDATRTQISLASGNGASTTITIPHGLSYTPFVVVQAGNTASAGITYTDADATNISIYYTVAPANGTNNLRYKIILK